MGEGGARAIRHGDAVRLAPLRGFLRHALRSPFMLLGLVVVAAWIAVAIFAPVISPYGPDDLVAAPSQGPSSAHLLGTDALGRDVLTRVFWGSRSVLTLAPIAVIIAECIGAAIGLLSGYVGGRVDAVIMRINDALISFPTILLYLLIIAALGPSSVNVVIAIAAGSIPGIARIVRGLVLDLRHRGYVSAARIRGEKAWYVMAVELLPNARSVIVVDATLRIAYAAFAIGTLGFLGLGTRPPTADWGGMVNEGVPWLSISAWQAAAPAVALASLVVGLNLIVDGMRDGSEA